MPFLERLFDNGDSWAPTLGISCEKQENQTNMFAGLKMQTRGGGDPQIFPTCSSKCAGRLKFKQISCPSCQPGEISWSASR